MSKNRFAQMQEYLAAGESRFQPRPAPRRRPSAIAFSTDANGTTVRQLEKNDWRTSSDGMDMIKKFEGFRANMYNDAAGHCTIGYGHLIHKGNCDGSESEEFRNGISEDRAEELMLEKLSGFENAINNNVTSALNQHQFDALVCFVYNIGAGAFLKSTLLKELNKGNYSAVPVEMRKWIWAGGKIQNSMKKRREIEAAVFERGEYPKTATAKALPFSAEFLMALEVVTREINRLGSMAFDTISYRIPGTIDPLTQPAGSYLCWAYVTTMMYNWRNQRSQTVETVMANIGPYWRNKITLKEERAGLYINEEEQFYRDAGFTYKEPQSLSIQGWEEALRGYGPLWIVTFWVDTATNKYYAHARLVVGIHGDGTSAGTKLQIVDPGDGSETSESFDKFIPSFEEEMRRIIEAESKGYKHTGKLRIQIVHFKDPIPADLQLAQSFSGGLTIVPDGLIADPFYRDREEKQKNKDGGRPLHLGVDIRGPQPGAPSQGLPVYASIRTSIPVAELDAVRVYDKHTKTKPTGLGLNGVGNAELTGAKIVRQPWRAKSKDDRAYGGALGLHCFYRYHNAEGEEKEFTLYVEYLHLITEEYLPKDIDTRQLMTKEEWLAKPGRAHAIGFGPKMKHGAAVPAAFFSPSDLPLVGYLGATESPHVHVQVAYFPGHTTAKKVRMRIDPMVVIY